MLWICSRYVTMIHNIPTRKGQKQLHNINTNWKCKRYIKCLNKIISSIYVLDIYIIIPSFCAFCQGYRDEYATWVCGNGLKMLVKRTSRL